MTTIYAADEQSLTLLPDLLSAHAIAEESLPAANNHIPFTTDIAAATPFTDDVTFYIAGKETLRLGAETYKDSTIETFCRILDEALPDSMQQENVTPVSAPSSPPEYR